MLHGVDSMQHPSFVSCGALWCRAFRMWFMRYDAVLCLAGTYLSGEFGPAQAHDSEEGFAEDASRHLACAELAVDEDDRHLLDTVSEREGCELHLNLEGIALEAYGIEVDAFEHLSGIAYESGCGVAECDAQYGAYVCRGIVAHEHAADGPVDDVDSGDVSRAYADVGPLCGTRFVKARQVVGVVAEVGIHLEDVFVAVCERPPESGDVGSAESELAGAFHNVEPIGKLAGDEALHDACRAVGAAVVDDEDVETVVIGVESEHGADDGFDVLFLVIRGYDNDAVALRHNLSWGCWAWGGDGRYCSR